jgi:hypothetical protein
MSIIAIKSIIVKIAVAIFKGRGGLFRGEPSCPCCLRIYQCGKPIFNHDVLLYAVGFFAGEIKGRTFAEADLFALRKRSVQIELKIAQLRLHCMVTSAKP